MYQLTKPVFYHCYKTLLFRTHIPLYRHKHHFTCVLREVFSGPVIQIKMSQNQKSITSFFSSKATGTPKPSPFASTKSPTTSKPSTSKSPSNVLKEKPSEKNSTVKSPKTVKLPKTTTKKPSPKAKKKKKQKEKEPESPVDNAIKEVKKVSISEDVQKIDDISSPENSPIKQSKRRRLQVLESDESGSDTENSVVKMECSGSPASAEAATPEEQKSPPSLKTPTPKRKTAKLSKEFRSRLANRVQTPYVSKTQVKEEDEEEKEGKDTGANSSKTKADLSSFAFKKRAKAEQSPTKKEDNSPKKQKLESSPILVKKLPTKDNSPAKEKSPIKQTSPTKKHKSPIKEQKPSPAGKETQSATKAKSQFSLVSAGSSNDYNPAKSNYEPIKDACWKAGEVVPYRALAATLFAIESESKRNDKTEILSNFLRSVCILSPEDLLISVYLCTNQVAPAYAGLELGIGDTVVMRALNEACGTNTNKLKEKMKKLGDLGLVAESSRATQKMMFKPKPLTINNVFETLREITTMSGNQSQGRKVSLIKKILVACDGPEARFITRSLLGKLRIGLAEQTVLTSLGHATLMTPIGKDTEDAIKNKKNKADLKLEAAQAVKTCFCEHPDYEHVIKMIKEHGVMDAVEHCQIAPGVPVKPMLANPTKGISEVLQRFEGAKFTCEFKYDGERAQIQRNKDGVISIFSRNQENNTSKYPDIIDRIGDCMVEGTDSFILDCEVVAWDIEEKRILPFQILTTRKRKDADIEEIKVKVCLFAFDLLYLNGEPLVRNTFKKRRELLHSAFKPVEGEFLFATAKDCTDTEEIQEFLDESIKGQCEGLMVKTLEVDATYEIAKRSKNWLKVKKDYLDGVADSLDLVVIGAYNGKGKRSGVYGGFLLACYDQGMEEYQAVCKIGTGFTDEDLASHHKTLSEHVVSDAKSYYSYPESNKPDIWFEPAVVWEVKCADLSISPIYTAAAGLVDSEKGISLRFPRFIRIRDDKGAEEATNSEQVADLYNKQDNKQEGVSGNADDFY